MPPTPAGPQRAMLEIDVGVQGLGVERGRQLAMLELQQNFGDACDARRTLAMPDIGFDRANGAEVPVPGVGTDGSWSRR